MGGDFSEGFVVDMMVDLLDLDLWIQGLSECTEKNIVHLRIIQGAIVLICA
jgi:hypothetical protein